MHVNKKAVGQRIKSIRLDKGETMDEFGKRFNTSKGTVNNWEKGRNLPNKENLLLLSNLADMSVDELLYGEQIETEWGISTEDMVRTLNLQAQRLFDSGAELMTKDSERSKELFKEAQIIDLVIQELKRLWKEVAKYGTK